MPAYEQLARYYFESATGDMPTMHHGAGATANSDRETLELGLLVCSQGLLKAPDSAALHNVAGLIHNQLGDLSMAARSFKRAWELEPTLFEAHMNYAAVNLQFRGFPQAEGAYREALKIRPSDYEAELGLALALRGQIDDRNMKAQLVEVSAALERAKRLSPERPEAYFNDAIVTLEFKAREAERTAGDPKAALPHLRRATELLRTFVRKAEGNDAYRASVEHARARLADIEQLSRFHQGV